MWERLGLELDRGAEQVYRRWWGGIEHVLTRHLAGESCILTYIIYPVFSLVQSFTVLKYFQIIATPAFLCHKEPAQCT